MDRDQLAAAISRSFAVSDTCTSFSASTSVVGDTGGPDAGAVANVGGAPGVVADGLLRAGFCSSRHAEATIPIDAVIRNCLRVFIRVSPQSATDTRDRGQSGGR